MHSFEECWALNKLLHLPPVLLCHLQQQMLTQLIRPHVPNFFHWNTVLSVPLGASLPSRLLDGKKTKWAVHAFIWSLTLSQLPPFLLEPVRQWQLLPSSTYRASRAAFLLTGQSHCSTQELAGETHFSKNKTRSDVILLQLTCCWEEPGRLLMCW